MAEKNIWHTKNVLDVVAELKSDEHGLSSQEAAARLTVYGPNRLPDAKVDSYLKIFLSQFRSPLIYTLFIASAIIFSLGQFTDSAIIIFVLIFNSVLGAIQEGRSRDILRVLRKSTETSAIVMRDGKEIIISDREVVPGDIINFREGEKIPADGRIISVNYLKIDESMLTGESVPVDKNPDVIENPDLPEPDRKNLVYKGTNVVAGSGNAVVFATGTNTWIGKISKKISEIYTEIPLSGDIRRFSRLVVAVVIILSIAIFALGVAMNKPAREMFATVVSLAVAIIPEGLPIVMTLVLASGVWRMSKRNALIKKLQAVEALGQANVIALDKTGTITRNELVIKKVFTGGKMFDVEGNGYAPQGKIFLNGEAIDPLNHPELIFAGKVAAFCSNARIAFSETTKEWSIAGDPTEAAIHVFSQKVGFKKDDLEKENPKITEFPFDYRAKYHAVVHKVDDAGFLSVVGASEVVLSLSTKTRHDGADKELEPGERAELESVSSSLMKSGYRVLVFSTAKISGGNMEHNRLPALTFAGLFAIEDSIRPGMEKVIREISSSGIKVVMITGDHKETAMAVAQQVGIWHDGDPIMTAGQIDALSDEELAGEARRVSVFARVTPEHKIRIINAYKRAGFIIAMTGDGVNDAPSLVAADLGIAMGKIGTEVAKEASDIVLLDDNLENIIFSIEEGRNILRAIKRVVLYLFSTNTGELLTIFGALSLGLPLPLTAAQIIWLNLVTDSFLDVSLGMEPKESGLLGKKLPKPNRYIIDSQMTVRIFIMAIPMAVMALFLFSRYLPRGLAEAQTVVLVTLAVFHWFNVWNCRSETKSAFRVGLSTNKFIILATFIVITLQALAVYTPAMQNILHTTGLGIYDLLTITASALTIVAAEEIRKLISWLIRRTMDKKNNSATVAAIS